MMKKILMFVIALAVCALASEKTEFYTPSFFCDNVKAESIEYKICTNEDLSKLDVELSKVYKEAINNSVDKEKLKKGQFIWMIERNKCKDNNCIHKTYISRVDELSSSLLNQKTFSSMAMELIRLAKNAPKVELKNRTVCNKIYSKSSIDSDLHVKQEYLKAKEKCGDFCSEFYEDLFSFKDIFIQKPLLDYVSYDNPKLKEYMGSCHEMKMDVDARYYYDNGSKMVPPQIQTHKEKALMRLWNIEFDGKQRLLLGRYFGRSDGSPDYFVLDQELCQKVTTKKNFDYLVDRDYIDQNRLGGRSDSVALNNQYIELIKYRGKDYIVELINWGDRLSRVDISLYGKVNKSQGIYFPRCRKNFHVLENKIKIVKYN